MKKLCSVLLIIILILSLSACLSGCVKAKVAVSSVLSIDEHFKGIRTVTAVYPVSADIDAVKDKILADDPTAEIPGASFFYSGVKEDGYYFELKLSFTDKAEYEKIVGSLIGRDTAVFLSRKNTALTQGTRMAEDFDVSELIAWMVSDTAAVEQTKNLQFDYSANTVQIGSDSYTTQSTAAINDCTGSAINHISIKTMNHKSGSYDRTFAFHLPNATYTNDKDKIEAYFLSNTLPEAKYAGWSAEGSDMVYTVIYEDMTVAKMADVTAKLLDTDSVAISYGDIDNASTPLSEGLTYAENLDSFSFIGENDGFPTIRYSYSLPLNTTYGEGSLFEDGRWVSAGAWENDLYTVELNSGTVQLRIPDGIQYRISGIDFSVASLGDSRFRRTTEFLYDADNTAAANYALSYFKAKGVENAAVNTTDQNIICSVSFEGTTDEITSQLVNVFGSGNFMAYEQKKGAFDLSIKTVLTDYVNLGYMLNSENAARPMHYSVSSEGGENIVSLSVDGSETAFTESNKGTMDIKGGCATVRYRGNIPVTVSIIIYITAGLVLLILTAFIAIKLIKPKKKRVPDPLNNPEAVYADTDMPEDATDDASENDTEDASSEEKDARAPLAQTTTFSIFELNTLVRNKKYVDEINKDVEQRLHAQSLEEQKHDIRARELEEISRKVYGARTPSSDETATDDIAEPIELEPTEAPESARESADAPAKENDDNETDCI
jgi:hypothetical protein